MKKHQVIILLTSLLAIQCVNGQLMVDHLESTTLLTYQFNGQFVASGSSSFGIAYDMAPLDPENWKPWHYRVSNYTEWSATVSIWDPERVADPIRLDADRTRFLTDFSASPIEVQVSAENEDTGFVVDAGITIGSQTYLSNGWGFGNSLSFFDPESFSELLVLSLLAGETIHFDFNPDSFHSSLRPPWQNALRLDSLSFTAHLAVDNTCDVTPVPEPAVIGSLLVPAALGCGLFIRRRKTRG